MKKIKVLIVEDSLMFRQILVRNLITDPMLEVVAQASDPYEARDAILKYEPDVMTLDIELPRMDGIEVFKETDAAVSVADRGNQRIKRQGI